MVGLLEVTIKMANHWFKLTETGSGTGLDGYRPDLKGYDVDGWSGNKTGPNGGPPFGSGNKTGPNGGPPWLVRVYADAATLDALEADLGAGEQRLSNVPTQALNKMFGQQRDAGGWQDGFNVGGQQ